MVTPRDPAAFRAEVLRRAMRIERRRRRARLLLAVPLVAVAILSVALVGQLRRDTSTTVVSANPGGSSLDASIVATGAARPWSVGARPDGTLWVLTRDADGRGHVGVVDERTWRSVAALPADARPESVVSGADGSAWLTDPASHRLLHVTASGRVDTIDTGAPPSATAVLDTDGRLWFAQPTADRLLAASPTGQLQPFPVPRGRQPDVVALAPNGSIAYGAAGAAQLGTISRSGSVVEYPLADRDARVTALALGPGPALWFATDGPAGARLGRVTGQGSLLDEGSVGDRAPAALTLGSDGRIWYSTGHAPLVHEQSLAKASVRSVSRAFAADAWAMASDGTVWAVDRSAGELVELTGD